jgi:hypothetical protein
MTNRTFTTYNYDRFKLNDVNRPIDEVHVANLMRSIKKFGLLVPILCDKQDNIVDGQHRYEACKRAKHQLTVQVRESYNMEKIVEVNSTSKRWSLLDYAHHHAALGSSDYEHFLDCVKEYPRLGKMSVAMACACEQINGTPFRNGNLVCQDKNKTAQILRLMEAARMHGMKAKTHHIAIMKYVLQGHPVHVLIDRLEVVADHMKVERPRNVKDAVRVWQDLYNWKRRQNTITL